jgi:lysophospholipase L1-like esterase
MTRQSMMWGVLAMTVVTGCAPVTSSTRMTAPYVTAEGRTIDVGDPATVRAAYEQADRKLRDWPQLGRFREANAELANFSPGEARVVFIGDSITDSWDNPEYGGFFTGKAYVNRGISAQTTPQMLLRLRADVLGLKPRAMVIHAGTNDIAGNTGPMTLSEIEDNITTIAELATLHGVRVVLASVLPVSNYHDKGLDPRGPQTIRRPMEKIRALNAWLARYAAEHGHVYLDYFSAMVDDRGYLRAELSEDDLHPNQAGYAIMAPLAEAAVGRALAGPAVKPTAGGSASAADGR